MKFHNVALDSIAYQLPPEVISSDDIEQQLAPLYERLKLPTGRIELMTGIKERRFWPNDTLPSQAATQAAQKALDQSSINKSQVDLLIHSAVCRDRLEPATAAYVHQALGLPSSTQFFDVSNACLGFLNAIIIAGSMIDSGLIQSALIVTGENGRPLLDHTLQQLLNNDLSRNDIKPYFANFTIGAGAAAAVVCHDSLVGQGTHSHKILASCIESDTTANALCQGGNAQGASGYEMQTDSEQLLEAGISLAKNTWQKFKSTTQWNNDTPEAIICHQVGSRHRNELYSALNLDLSKDFSTFETLGNVGSASLPITLAMAIEEEHIQPDDLVALLGIGSGLSSAMLALHW